MATAGGDSNAGDNDGPGTSGMGDGGEPGHDSGLGDRGGYGGNTEGSDGGYYRQPTVAQYLTQATPFESLSMGGAPNTPYQTVAPGYTDLKAKHTAGYVNPATKERSNPSMFNFNGTVYRYEPDQDAYRDTYTGQLITPVNNEVGSSGIAGLYGAYEANQYQPNNTNVQPNMNKTHNPDNVQVLNPEWTKQQERIKTKKEADEAHYQRFPGDRPGKGR